MSSNQLSEANRDPPPRTITQRDSPAAGRDIWLFAWGGTALAGGAFGLLLGLRGVATGYISGAVLGLVLGFAIAAVVAAPVVLTMVTACWALALRRIRPLLAILVGGVTGILSVLSLALEPPDGILPRGLAPMAGVAGALGSGIAIWAWARKHKPLPYATWGPRGGAGASFFARLFRVSVFAALIASWAAPFHWYEESWVTYRRAECEGNLSKIADLLHSYVKAHKSLPPAYLTNKDGLAVLSWRVCAAQFSHDNDLRRIDFSRPWNGPENASLVYFNYPFGYYNDLFHCPGSFEEPENPLTDYVAVVGPDTLGPGKTPGDLKTHPKAILVVEWPKSNIHWAEPRDISVEEFLEWFRAKPPRRGLWDWFCATPVPGDGFHRGGLLYVDAEGHVGQLPRDTDPETVRKMLAGRSK